MMGTNGKVVALMGALLWSWSSSTSAVPVNFYNSFAGNINFQATGASLRTQPNTGNACLVSAAGTTVNATLSGIPVGATIRSAFLYWAGSYSTAAGSTQTTPDTTVTFQGSTVNASRVFLEPFVFNGNTYDFFSGFADVTTLVTGNGTYGLSGLTVNTGAPHCPVQAVVAGWTLIAIYDNPGDPLRVINIFDGLQYFRGSSLDLVPNNFQIPAAGCGAGGDCKFGVITWEGDVENSGALGGFTEDLFINPPPPPPVLSDAVNPSGNQYNSTISLPDVVGVPNSTTSWGLDLDVYALTTPAHLAVGDTSSVTRYSSGADLVLLNAEIFSVRNTPVADLAITKSHTGNFVAGQQGTYTITVSNNGPNNETNTITVTDTLPAGLTYSSATSTDVNWSCGAVGQTVTCTHPGPLNNGNSLADISLTVDVAAAAAPSVNNTASVSSATFDNIAANDSSTDATNVLVPDLSTSTKSVLDLNGGDADPGDVLRYTITINESASAAISGVSVTDTIDPLLTGFTVVSVPAGATDGSTPGTGPLNVSGINVPAGGSATIVFDATIVGSANPGDLINNTAVINNPVTATNINAFAPTITVSASAIPSFGTKQLYFYMADAPAPNTNTIQRVVNPTNTLSPIYAPGNSYVTTLSPPTQQSLTLQAGNIPVQIWLRRRPLNSGNRNVTVTLDYFGGSTGVIGSQTLNGFLNVNPWQLITFNINLAAPVTLNPNTTIRCTIRNEPTSGGNIRARSLNNGQLSQILLNAATVINVDSVDAYDAVYPGGVIPVSVVPNNSVFLRAAVSDPFGSFDITGANIEIVDPLGTTVQASTAMTEVNDSTVATKTYEYQYTVPNTGPNGSWTVRVTANEGTEGTVSDLGVGTFDVVSPSISVLKMVSTVSDPVNGGSNPKAIPGSVIEYQIIVSNSGTGPASNVALTDSLDTEITAGWLAYGADAYDAHPTCPGAGPDRCGILVTAPAINLGNPQAITNASDSPTDEGDFTLNVINMNVGDLEAGEQATIRFRAQVI